MVAGGCSLTTSLNGLTGGSPAADGGPDGGVDAAADAPDSPFACPATTRGPKLVDVGGFCIDSTEVTNAQYEAFLAAGGIPLTRLPHACAYVTSLAPKAGWPPVAGAEATPVAYVDWCDAWAFCLWAGKRLCGRIDGGAIEPSALNDPQQDQWFHACSHDGDGQHYYPYGNVFEGGVCNGPELGLPPWQTGTSACQGGFPGLFDMTGNVDEWIDSCIGDAGADAASCLRRGGSFHDPASVDQTCGSKQQSWLTFGDDDIGFRCCAP
jgi:formylglycine-generating enzyme required for sulfatase activity